MRIHQAGPFRSGSPRHTIAHGARIRSAFLVCALVTGTLGGPADTARHLASPQNAALQANQQIAGASCRNGCGPDGWVADIVGALLDAFFEEACNRHDSCYCSGYATYCKDRETCDDDFQDDTLTACDEWAFLPPVYLDCVLQATAAYAAVSNFGDSFYVDVELQSCNEYDTLGEEWSCLDGNPAVVFVDSTFAGCPQHGTASRPLVTLTDAIATVAPAGLIECAGGPYPGSITITKPLTLASWTGVAVDFGAP